MKLSVELLLERLDEIIVSYHYGEDPKRLNLKRPEFLMEKSPLLHGHLYITRTESLPTPSRIPNGCCLVCIGEPPSSYLEQGYSVLCAQEGHDIFDMFNKVSAIFEHYDDWERQLLQCISEKTPIQRFVDVSMNIFENQMYIVDSTLRQLARSTDKVISNMHRDIIAEDMESLAKLYASAQSVSDCDDATILWNERLKLRVITKALRSHNRFAITITLIEANRPFRESDSVLLDYMSYYVLMAFDYEHTYTSEEESPISLATILTQLLREEIVPIEKIENAQAAFGWKRGHSLCVFYVKTPKPEYNFTTRIYHCQQMERQFTSAIAIASLGENNVIFVNISLSEKYNESVSRFISVLKRFDFVCGMSCEFKDITKVTEYYTQAKYAYYYGSLSDPGQIIYEFSEYGLQFMLSHCCDGQAPECLFPVGLKDIIAHDKLYGTQYLKTIIAFCDSNFNATHAANQLHIHRTTFLDRLSRMQDFSKLRFDDSADRLHLLLSLELLKESGENPRWHYKV